MSDKPVLKVKCPKCKKEYSYYTSEYRPFCCRKCQLLDLGKWLDEGYSVASEEAPAELGTDEYGTDEGEGEGEGEYED